MNDKTDYSLDEMCKLENDGAVFAKIAKSNEFAPADGVGSRYQYEHGINTSDNEKGFTIVKIEHVMNFLHYGDLLVVVSFNMLAKELNDASSFWITQNNPPKDYQFQTNFVYVTEIISLKTQYAYDTIIDKLDLDSETGLTKICERINTLRERADEYRERADEYYKAALYYVNLLNKRFPDKCPRRKLIGTTEEVKGKIFKKKTTIDKQIEIDFVDFKLLESQLRTVIDNGVDLPEPVEINGIKYRRFKKQK